MQYIHKWFKNGVVTRYTGNASLDVLIRSQSERDCDVRFQNAEFLLVDATEVVANDIDLSSTHIMGRKANRAWVVNPTLHILLVSNSEVMTAILDAYCAYMRVICCPWKFTKYHYLEEAITVANRLYNCELSVNAILTDTNIELTHAAVNTHRAQTSAPQPAH